MLKKKNHFFIFLSLFWVASWLFADEPISVQEYYGKMTTAYQNQNWEVLIQNSQIVVEKFAGTPFAEEAWYYLGVAHFYRGDYDLSNRKLSYYLKNSASPKFFEEALYYKFQVAEKFREGAKKHVLNWEKSPQWLPAKEDAVQIYEEVINTFPFHELAARSLFGKAKLQQHFEEHRQSIETLQLLIRRFPKHELAIESYLEISKIYLTQSQMHQDPDLLDSAEVNLRRFRQAFPGESRWEEAKKTIDDMKEVFATSLYEIARFYERTKKVQAAIIYYTKVVSKFPESKSAEQSRKQLERLKK